MRCYLDYNASAPLMKEVKEYIISTLDINGNPSSIHNSGREAKNILEDARLRVAELVNADKDSIIFTSGATEANNIVVHNVRTIPAVGAVWHHLLADCLVHLAVVLSIKDVVGSD